MYLFDMEAEESQFRLSTSQNLLPMMPLRSKAYRARMKNLFLQSKSSPEVLRESDSSQQLPTTPCPSHACKDTVSFDSDLTEIITCFDTSHGHSCDFYLKFHCKLNVIEQYLGAAKLCYRISTQTANIDIMEKNMLSCLDDVPLVQIRR